MATRPIVRIVVDRRREVDAAIKLLASTSAMVGIPAKTAQREDGKITSAALGYIHEMGAPEHNLPARPWLRPGVADKLSQIAGYLKQAGTLGMQGNRDGMLNALRAAGQSGATGAQQKITTGPFAPLSERTIIARLRKTQAGQTRLRRMRRAGQDVVQWGQANLRPLIDTGAMRRAVTYVLRSRGRDV